MLKKLLNEQLEELKKEGKTFRSGSDIKKHLFYVSTDSIAAEMWNQVFAVADIPEKEYYSEELANIIETQAKKVSKAIWDTMKPKEGAFTTIAGTEDNFVVTTVEAERALSVKTGEFSGKATVFDALKNSYKSQARDAARALNAWIATRRGVDDFDASSGISTLINESAFLDLGHKGESAIARQRVRGSEKAVQDRINKFNKRAKQQNRVTSEDITELGLDFVITKTDTDELTTIQTGLESAFFNRLEGQTELKAFKQAYIKALEKAVKKLERSQSFAKRPGSDSRLEIESKKAIKTFNDSIKSKKVKKKSRDTKPNYSKGTTAKVSQKKKVKKASETQIGVGDLGFKKGRKKKSSAQSNISLMALLNAKLPDTVAKNMGAPALVFRTGRFAGSARVTDIQQTTKGYPSIGYTYQRNPYQTFEPGYAQGSAVRDPRRVIDRSIREIARELLTGRFFTRRT